MEVVRAAFLECEREGDAVGGGRDTAAWDGIDDAGPDIGAEPGCCDVGVVDAGMWDGEGV